MPEIEVKNLHVEYPLKHRERIQVINDLSFVFKDGDFNVIIGESGCGKTTLMKTLLGLKPYIGEILLDGVNIENYSIGDRNFAYVSQDIVLQPQVTVFDNIAYPLKIRGVDKKTIVEKVYAIAKELNIFEILPCRPKQISIGQAQRVAIARALVKNASFYFFDEPFSNLDAVNRNIGRHLIHEVIKSHHASAVYITHSISEATSLSDKVFVMYEGEFIFSGTSEELMKSTNEHVKELIETTKEDE